MVGQLVNPGTEIEAFRQAQRALFAGLGGRKSKSNLTLEEVGLILSDAWKETSDLSAAVVSARRSMKEGLA